LQVGGELFHKNSADSAAYISASVFVLFVRA
jgi:hypothetical protein